LEKFRDVFVKIRRPEIFQILQNYFSKEKSIEYVQGAWSTSARDSLNVSRSARDA
jgi:hypothetical protein